MIPVDDARERILAHMKPTAPEIVPLSDGLGRVLAKDVAARRTQPPRAVSAMDGYAARAADVAAVPVTLACIGEAPAGGAFEGCVEPGQTVRIFTGGPLPDGADTIVIQENTTAEGDRITVTESAEVGRYVRRAGLDFQEGTVVLKAGHVLTVRDVALASAMNHPWLHVRRRPRVAILATGDEVVMPGEPIGANQIASANELGLAAVVSACGGEPVMLGVAPDKSDVLGEMVARAQGADLLVTTGGVSVGARDLVGQALRAQGMDLGFWKIAMRPGKPLMFGLLDSCPVLGMPGNPVSTMICSLLFLRPAIAKMLAMATPPDETETAILQTPLRENDQRQDYLRARLNHDDRGRLLVQAYPKQDSSVLSVLAQADGLVVRPPHAPAAAKGDRVPVIRYPTGLVQF